MSRLGAGAMAMLLAVMSAEANPAAHLAAANALRDGGNHAEAYAVYTNLVLDAQIPPHIGTVALPRALECLGVVNRVREADGLLDAVVTLHGANWRMLAAAADAYTGLPPYGFVIAGDFERGYHRGDGREVNASRRDRVRALQLYDRARTLALASGQSGAEVGHLLRQFGVTVLGQQEFWRLQTLTDLKILPDYDDGYNEGPVGGDYAPSDAAGNPVFYALPASYAAASCDGERWRALLDEAVRHYRPLEDDILRQRADFAFRQFGVQTLQEFNGFFRNDARDAGPRDAAFLLHTLAEHETIARLAGGIKRFALPEDWNFIRLYRDLAGRAGTGEQALNQLAQIFENRRQFPAAAVHWRWSIERYGDPKPPWKQKRLDQIEQNWGGFDEVSVFPAGTAATVDYRFRNGGSVVLEARAIRMQALLDDIKKHLADNPREINFESINIGSLGWRLIQKDGEKYVGETVAKWTETLSPPPDHFDRLVTLETPLKDTGAYLLTARMEKGNTSRIILWIADTVIARKPLDGRSLYFVADAVTGTPVEGATVEFFGYRQEYVDGGKTPLARRQNVITRRFAEKTDAAGLVTVGGDDGETPELQWLVTATTRDPSAAADEARYSRFAFLGFDPVWTPRRYEEQYNEIKVFSITDRPVYRPEQTVQFKLWVREAQYDLPEDASRHAGGAFTVVITDPRNEKILERSFTADAYGGLSGELALGPEAVLGVYQIGIAEIGGGQGTFRVEEYKKPEFEVTVETPAHPLALGDTVGVTVKAAYLFGAPVTEATVHVKVTRSAHSTVIYPVGIWDWFYGNGYGWLGYDCPWFSGWNHWGCPRPRGGWWPEPQQPPEVVADIAQPIGPDGTVTVTLDTAMAKAMHGDQDHRYTISAEVTDASRRTITGGGSLIAARDPFRVFAWISRGHCRAGETVTAEFSARSPADDPVTGAGTATLFRVTYNEQRLPVEQSVGQWPVATDAEGGARLQIMAARPGQYRLACVLTAGGQTREGATLFSVTGEDAKADDYRFNAIELVPDKQEYASGETVALRVNTDRPGSAVLLFVRPANGVYLPPQLLRLEGRSSLVEIPVTLKDMPNFFIEAVTVSDGHLHSDVREIIVPPAQRVLNVDVIPSADRFQPGASASVRVRVTDRQGAPVSGSVVLAVYDRALEYISVGSNVPEIRAFFWKWRRHHNPVTRSSLERQEGNVAKPGEEAMQAVGVFGHLAEDAGTQAYGGGAMRLGRGAAMKGMRSVGFAAGMAMPMAGAAPEGGMLMEFDSIADRSTISAGEGDGAAAAAAVTVRTEFADTAFWAAMLTPDAQGVCDVVFPMPENLTSWCIKAWAMAHGTRVGEGVADVVTAKNLLLRLQAPRFFVETDVVTLSANIHNNLDSAKTVRAVLELDGEALAIKGKSEKTVRIPAGGETRVDWTVRAVGEGESVVRMKALSDEESDAMERVYPVYVHGMLKTDSFSGVIRPDAETATVTLNIPRERRKAQSRLELRWSPTLAGAMVDALPYLVSYPYGCTEQTLNRFLPTVITQRILKESGVSLAGIRAKRSHLNAQETGDEADRARQWRQSDDFDPVFDEAEVDTRVKAGVNALAAMQNSDGGWGWFYGPGGRSHPHTSVTVVRGLMVAKANGVAILPGVLENGLSFLHRSQDEETARLGRHPDKDGHKLYADNLDAYVYMTLVEGGILNEAMGGFLYRDRNHLSVYGKTLLAMALRRLQKQEELAMVMRNIEQVLVRDAENQTAWLDMQNSACWWNWYGSEFEAHAFYLKLLAALEPKSEKTAGLVKYLLNNRKHATYWNSTRDTALCIEALADYLRASGEGRPDMTVELLLNGVLEKEMKVTPETLFSFDNRVVLEGDALKDGELALTLRRRGTGPVYFNAYLTNFTREDPIRAAGLEIKVQRKVYRLVRDDREAAVSGAHGQAVSQRVERFRREPLERGAVVTSGDLIEVELELESKNDYEYIVIEDMKAAGFEAVEQRSGYLPNDLGAYLEFRDERVSFLVRQLARGRHSVSYRLRAEIPGKFSSLPARISAMYAPELKGNSEEIKLEIRDR
jgi:uncharacterized protein YfaS (alpha-2-macroglobulin family)